MADHLKLGRFTLAGNSMGGGVAWQYALKHPDRLEGLVLVDAAGFPEPAQKGSPVAFKILRNPVVAMFENADESKSRVDAQ